MKRREIQFSPPDITEAEISEVAKTLQSGWITTDHVQRNWKERLLSGLVLISVYV